MFVFGLRLGKGEFHKKYLGGGDIFGLRLEKFMQIFLSLIKVKKSKSYKDNFVNIINFYLIIYLFLSFAKQVHETFIFKVLIQVPS